MNDTSRQTLSPPKESIKLRVKDGFVPKANKKRIKSHVFTCSPPLLSPSISAPNTLKRLNSQKIMKRTRSSSANKELIPPPSLGKKLSDSSLDYSQADNLGSPGSSPPLGGVKKDLTCGFMGALVDDGGHTLDENGISPIYKAAATGKQKSIHLLLQANRDVNTPNSDGATPLHAAVANGHFDTVKYLIRQRANVEAQTNKEITPFLMACSTGNLKLAELLLPQNPNDLLTSDGKTPLLLAVQSKDLGLCRFLLEKKCDAQYSPVLTGHSVLHEAAKLRLADICTLLISYNADFTQANISGNTPLAMAEDSSSGFFEFATNHTTQDKEEIQRFLTRIFCFCCLNDNQELMESLSACHNFDASLPLSSGCSLLVYALSSHAIKIAITLLDNHKSSFLILSEGAIQLILETHSVELIEKMLFILAAQQQKKKTPSFDFSHLNLHFIPPDLIAILLKYQNDPILSKIKQLNFKNNKIQILPMELLDLPDTYDVKLEGNPLDMIPAENRSEGWSTCKEYLLTIRDRAKQWRDCKLMIIGQEEASRQAIVRHIIPKKSKIAQSSTNTTIHGRIVLSVENTFLKEKELSAPTTSKASVLFNVWELGTEDTMLPTHKFLLSNKAIYIVTFSIQSCTEGNHCVWEEKTKLYYWMQQLKYSTQSSQAKAIYLVGTYDGDTPQHAVKRSIQNIQKCFPKQTYPGIEGILAVNTKNGEGMEEIKVKILRDVSSKGLLPYVPPTWVKLYDLISSKVTPTKYGNYVTRETFDVMAMKCGLEGKEDISKASRFLINIGNILVHKINQQNQKESLHDIIILRPLWLTTAVSTVFSFKGTRINNGILQSLDTRHVFESFDRNIGHVLQSIFQSFRIFHPVCMVSRSTSQRQNIKILQSIEGFFIPSTLPEDLPDKELQNFWEKGKPVSEVARSYRFPFLPLDFYATIITRLFHMPGFIPHYFWKNGAFFYFRTSGSPFMFRVAIQFDPNSFSFSLRMLPVQETNDEYFIENRGRIFALLIDAVDTVLQEFKLGDVSQRFVPCSHCLEQRRKPRGVPSLAFTGGETKPMRRRTTMSLLPAKREKTIQPGLHFRDIFMFSYPACVKGLIHGGGFVFCHDIHSPTRTVCIASMAPDIAMVGISELSGTSLLVEKKIGQGGFGSVYKGKLKTIITENEAETQIVVAVKEANVNMEEAEYVYSDFRQECFIMSIMTPHPNVLKFFGITLQPKPRMILEFMPCGDLDQLLRPKNGTTPSFTIHTMRLRLLIALDIAKGMRSLHNEFPPIIHRDLRSPNIFIASLDELAPVRAKVADFGLSRVIAPDISGVLDTWQWLAPEVIGVIDVSENWKDAASYGRPSDVYSFAICCWELLTCKYPFQEYETDKRFCRVNESGATTVFLTKLKRAIYIDHLRPTLPIYENSSLSFNAIIRDCWKTNPRERPTFNEIVERLEGLPELKIEKRQMLHKLKNIKVASPKSSPRASKVNVETRKLYNDEFEVLKEVRIPLRAYVSSACFRIRREIIESEEIWVGCESGVIMALDASDNALPVITIWDAHHSKVTSLAAVGNTVWSGSSTGDISIWNSMFTLIKECIGFKKQVVVSHIQHIKRSTSEDCVWITASDFKSIRAYTIHGDFIQIINMGKSARVHSIFDQNDFVWIGTDKHILLYDKYSMAKCGSFVAHTDKIVSIHESNGNVWTCTSTGDISIWRVDGMQISCNAEKREQAGQELLGFSAWGSHLLSTGAHHIALWDTTTQRPVHELAFQSQGVIDCIAIAARNILFVLCKNGLIKVFHLRDDKDY